MENKKGLEELTDEALDAVAGGWAYPWEELKKKQICDKCMLKGAACPIKNMPNYVLEKYKEKNGTSDCMYYIAK